MAYSNHYLKHNCWILTTNSDKIKYKLQILLDSKNQDFRDLFYKRLICHEFLNHKLSDKFYYIKFGNKKRVILKIDSELKKILIVSVIHSSYLNKIKTNELDIPKEWHQHLINQLTSS